MVRSWGNLHAHKIASDSVTMGRNDIAHRAVHAEGQWHAFGSPGSRVVQPLKVRRRGKRLQGISLVNDAEPRAADQRAVSKAAPKSWDRDPLDYVLMRVPMVVLGFMARPHIVPSDKAPASKHSHCHRPPLIIISADTGRRDAWRFGRRNVSRRTRPVISIGKPALQSR